MTKQTPEDIAKFRQNCETWLRQSELEIMKVLAKWSSAAPVMPFIDGMNTRIELAKELTVILALGSLRGAVGDKNETLKELCGDIARGEFKSMGTIMERILKNVRVE